MIKIQSVFISVKAVKLPAAPILITTMYTRYWKIRMAVYG